MQNKKKVVVTGLGAVSSIGIGKEAYWQALQDGKSGISPITSFDTSFLRYKRGGEVKDFRAEEYIPPRKAKFFGRASQMAIAASQMALDDAKIIQKEISRQRFGVMVGTTIGEKPLEELSELWARGNYKEIDKKRILQSSVNNISVNTAVYFKAQGDNFMFTTACAAGNYAIGWGADLIANGELDYCLAGGADSFFYVAFLGFQRLYAMAPDRCQPFDKNRKGMMLGEGSGMLMLESLESAEKRGAQIYAEIPGYGLSCDAFHPTAPDVSGIAKAMEKAILYSGLNYKDVDYINAHGTGTPANDKAECAAIKQVFKDHYSQVAVSSTKSMLGHAMGAASALEAVACCFAVKYDIIPPTINFETPDPDCDIDCVANVSRKQKVRVALNNGFAFGGNNACVAIKKFTG